MLFDAVHAKSPSAGGFDGQGWNDFGALSVGCFDGGLQSRLLWKNLGSDPDHLLDAFFVMIPKESHWAKTVLCASYRLQAMGHGPTEPHSGLV